jgi:hypothetical protein
MDGNDFIQSIFTNERHRQFEREVEKDRLAKEAASPAPHGRLRALANHACRLMHRPTRRRARVLPARD